MNDQTQRSTGNPTAPSPQALELTGGVWIALGLVVLLGLSRGLHDHDQFQTLASLDKEKPDIVRLRSQTHIFPRIGIKVAAVDGWTYLSMTDDALADRPTFVNESTNSIVSLRQFRFRTWPPFGGKVTTKQYGDVAIEWIDVDHRRVGRLTKRTRQGDVDVAVMVMTHTRKLELNQSVEEFCQAIQCVGFLQRR